MDCDFDKKKIEMCAMEELLANVNKWENFSVMFFDLDVLEFNHITQNIWNWKFWKIEFY